MPTLALGMMRLLMLTIAWSSLVAAEPAVTPEATPAATNSGGSPSATPAGGDAFISDSDWSRAAHVAPGNGTATSSASPGGSIVRLMGALGLVLALAAGGAWLVKRLAGRRILPGRGRHLEVMETLPVGLKRSLLLVRLGDQVVLIGSSEQGLHQLTTLPDGVLKRDQTATSVAAMAPVATSALSTPVDTNVSVHASASSTTAVPASQYYSGFAKVLEELSGAKA